MWKRQRYSYVKEVLQRVRRDKKNLWNRKLEEYLKKVNLGYENIEDMSQEELKQIIRKRDTEQWEKELETKKSLTRYRTYKKKMKQEEIYDNRLESKLLFRARTGTLELNIEKRHKGEDTTCELCKSAEETDVQFLL